MITELTIDAIDQMIKQKVETPTVFDKLHTHSKRMTHFCGHKWQQGMGGKGHTHTHIHTYTCDIQDIGHKWQQGMGGKGTDTHTHTHIHM
jgi:hypothetical protein